MTAENHSDRHCYTFGPYVVDAGKRLLWRNHTLVPITSKAFEILLLLIQRRGRVVEKQELLDEIWRRTAVEENTLTRHISTLRKILEERPDHHEYVLTIPGHGFNSSRRSPSSITGPSISSTPWPGPADPTGWRRRRPSIPVRWRSRPSLSCNRLRATFPRRLQSLRRARPPGSHWPPPCALRPSRRHWSLPRSALTRRPRRCRHGASVS